MRIEYYFDFSCPYAYLGSTRIEEIARRTGAELAWRPMLLGGVFRAIGSEGGPPKGPAKARHNKLDMLRYAEHWRVPLSMPATHPMRTVRALRTLLAVDEERWGPLAHAIYRAYWVRGEDVTADATLARALADAGVAGAEAERALAAGSDPAIKEELRRRTDEAVARGVFGAPTIFVGDGGGEPLMFFGQDRLELVEAAARGWRPAGVAPHARATVDFWYDFSSPFSYLAACRIEETCSRAGAELRWRPMLLGGLFKQIGTANVPLFSMPEARRRWMRDDLQAFAAWWRLPLVWNSRFPIRTVTPLRVALVAGEQIGAVSRALFRAAWVEDRDIGDNEVLAAVLAEGGFSAQALLDGTKDPAIKQRLIDNGAEAARLGVFGAPTFVVTRPGVEPEVFWGQDRLALVERAAS